MTLRLTIDNLRAAYNYLNETEPFVKWNLPDGDEVKFIIMRDTNTRGSYWTDGPTHWIGISKNCIARTPSLMETMAHEMIHLHEANAKACGRGQHSAAFKKWAQQVCKIHGFDEKLF